MTDAGTIVGVDGQKGFGQSIGAAGDALSRSSARGATGSVHRWACRTRIISRASAAGRSSARKRGFASIHFVNVLSTPLVAPWGGSDARLATNPFCVGVPHAPHPLVLDYATSMVAMGKARVALDAGKPWPTACCSTRRVSRPTIPP